MAARSAKFGLSVVTKLKERLVEAPDREVAEVSKQGVIERLIPELLVLHARGVYVALDRGAARRRGLADQRHGARSLRSARKRDRRRKEGQLEAQTTAANDRRDGPRRLVGLRGFASADRQSSRRKRGLARAAAPGHRAVLGGRPAADARNAALVVHAATALGRHLTGCEPTRRPRGGPVGATRRSSRRRISNNKEA